MKERNLYKSIVNFVFFLTSMKKKLFVKTKLKTPQTRKKGN